MLNFEINNDKLRLRATDTFGDGKNCVLYLDKFDGEKWNALAYPDFYLSPSDTSEAVYDAVKIALAEINKALESLYGKDTAAPINGIDLVRWIVANDVEMSDKKLSIKGGDK